MDKKVYAHDNRDMKAKKSLFLCDNSNTIHFEDLSLPPTAEVSFVAGCCAVVKKEIKDIKV